MEMDKIRDMIKKTRLALDELEQQLDYVIGDEPKPFEQSMIETYSMIVRDNGVIIHAMATGNPKRLVW